MNKPHEHWQSMLPFYVARQLSDDEQTNLENHLINCSECADLLTDWQRIAQAVRSRAHRATSLPLLRLPQRTASSRFRIALSGTVLLGAALIFILIMQRTVVPTQYGSLSVTPTLALITVGTPLPAVLHQQNYRWEKQGWNNQGPANLVQVLRHFGWDVSQDEAARILKPNRNDKFVSFPEMVEFVHNHTDLAAMTRAAGTIDLLKRLVAADFGVIVAVSYEVSDLGWMGHYLTITGYDDNEQVVYSLDTYLSEETQGQGRREKYETIDRRWQAFNRTYMVVYPKQREAELASILGSDANLQYNANNALNIARTEASMQPDLPWAWFNMGSSFVMLERYEEAVLAFQKARAVEPMPYRLLWYQFGIYEAYYHTGNYNEVIMLATSTLNTTPDVEETYYWRGMAYAALDSTESAIADFEKAVKANPNFAPAQAMIEQLSATQEF